MQVRNNFRYIASINITTLKNIFGSERIMKCAQIINNMSRTLQGVCLYQENTDVPKLSLLSFYLKNLVLNNNQSHPNFIQRSLDRFPER